MILRSKKALRFWVPIQAEARLNGQYKALKKAQKSFAATLALKIPMPKPFAWPMHRMCAGGDAAVQYNKIIDRVIGLLNGSDSSILEEMEQRMAVAAEHYDFETAAKYRDYIGAVSFLIHKEKVIEFAQENQNIAVLEAMNEQTLKLILLKGNLILSHTKLQYDQPDITHLQAAIKSAIMTTFHSEPNQTPAAIGRHEIDEAQIIYSYLKSSSCSYIIIQEDWLAAEQRSNMEASVNELLQIFLNAVPSHSYN